MLKRSFCFPAAVLLTAAFLCGCAAVRASVEDQPGSPAVRFSAPSLLPGTSVQMRTAGYWIAKDPSPDSLIMDGGAVAAFNSSVCRLTGVLPDISLFPGKSSRKTLFDSLRGQLRRFRSGRYYRVDGTPAGRRFYSEIEENMSLCGDDAGEITVRYAYVVHNSDQRLLPVKEAVNELPGDADFDELQNSLLGPGTPVAVLHTSRDGKWHYVRSTASEGWVEACRLAFCGREETSGPGAGEDFVVVTAAKADIYLDRGLTEYYDYCRMGDRFVLKTWGPRTAEIVLFTRDGDGSLRKIPGYMSCEEISRGYLPYTPRNVLRQAFKLLNAPYGWGGMHGEQDCSQFVREVFSVMGIRLPRNSADQAKAGRLLAGVRETAEEKRALLERAARGGMTTICLDGHIMLFLGMDGGRPYAIHDVWAYRVKGAGGKDELRLINRVAVTGLELGEGSRKGSFLDRIKCLRMIAEEYPSVR